MAEFIQKFLDSILGPEAVLLEPNTDPSTEGLKVRAGRKTLLIVGLLVGIPLICGVIIFGTTRAMAAVQATRTITPSPTLPNPVVMVEGAEASPTPSSYPNILTAMASETLPASPTQINVDNILTSLAVTATPCATSDHWMTEVACNDIAITETMEAVGVGTPINVSGVSPNETVIYVYPTEPPTAWVVTATFTNTPVVITATPGPTQTISYQVITTTPGPTQTPFFWVTNPPIVTVVIPQTVVVQQTQVVEVTREVTVIVTATPTDTPTPTETPTP